MRSHVQWTEHATTTVVMIKWQEALTQQMQKAMKWLHASGEEGGVPFMSDQASEAELGSRLRIERKWQPLNACCVGMLDGISFRRTKGAPIELCWCG